MNSTLNGVTLLALIIAMAEIVTGLALTWFSTYRRTKSKLPTRAMVAWIRWAAYSALVLAGLSVAAWLAQEVGGMDFLPLFVPLVAAGLWVERVLWPKSDWTTWWQFWKWGRKA